MTLKQIALAVQGEESQALSTDETCPDCGRALDAVKLDGARTLNGSWGLSSKECPGLFNSK